MGQGQRQCKIEGGYAGEKGVITKDGEVESSATFLP